MYAKNTFVHNYSVKGSVVDWGGVILHKYHLLIVVSLLILVILASNIAYSVSQSKPKDEVNAHTPVTSFKNKQLHVAVFQGGYGPEYWREIVEKFEAYYPGVQVNLTISPRIGDVIRAQIIAGNPPDFLAITDTEQSGIMNALIKEKGLLNLTSLFEEDALDQPKKIKDMILPGLLESARFSPYEDENIYLAPFNAAPMGLIYNKQLFEEKNWKLPESWDEFFALADELEKQENYVLNENGTLQKRTLFTYQGIYPEYLEEIVYPSIANVAGIEQLKKIFTYEPDSFHTPEVKKVLDILAKLGSEKYLLEGTFSLNHTQAQREMMLGKALFIVNGSWMEHEMKDSPREEGFKFGMIPVPTFQKNDRQYILSSYEQFSIPLKAKNPELAKAFLKFLYTDESVKLFAEKSNGVFALKDAEELAKNYLSTGVYDMFNAFEGTTAIIQEWKVLPKDIKFDIDDYLYKHMVTPVLKGEQTTTDWMSYVEQAFAEIQLSLDTQQYNSFHVD